MLDSGSMLMLRVMKMPIVVSSNWFFYVRKKAVVQ